MDFHLGALMLLGPTMDPRVASNISMRLPHLGLRMVEHSRRALYFAQKLEAKGFDETYPGLKSHQDHGLLTNIGNEPYGAGGYL